MSTYSPILRTELIGAGEQPGTWGSTTNSNFQYIFENAIAGYQAVTVSPTANNQVLTYVSGPSASPSLNQSIYGMLKLNAGTLGANFNIFSPPVSKTFIVWNNTSYTATFYNSSVIGNTTAAGSGVTIPAGAKAWIWSDGTNFWSIDTNVGNFNISGNLTVSGTTTLTGALSGSTGTFSGALNATGIITSSTYFNGPGTGLTGTAAGLNIGGNAATSTQAVNATNLNGVAQLCGYSISGQDIAYTSAGGPTVTAQASGAGMMTFIRPGSYAINFGLGTDNQLRTGGCSRGGSYVILDSGNYNNYAPTLTGGNASGTWGINVTGSSSTVTTTVASGATGTTQATGTNNTQLATTAFVQNSLASYLPSGTRLVFAQASAPTGWTQDVSDTANNRMMRVVNSAGGGVGGAYDPTIMDVVPYHTHGFTSGTQSADHSHYTSGQTGGESANHYHNVAGGTGYMDQSNPHSHGVYDPTHSHYVPGDNFMYQFPYGSGANVRGDYSASRASLIANPGTSASATGISIYNTDINHTHQFNVNSGYVSNDHSHAWGANSGGVSANHTHSGSTDGGSSQTNWTPRYVNLIICQKN